MKCSFCSSNDTEKKIAGLGFLTVLYAVTCKSCGGYKQFNVSIGKSRKVKYENYKKIKKD